jgi:predicted TIM-barrel fold metal-dependent hydrolase
VIADAHCHFFSACFFETLGRQRGDASPVAAAIAAAAGVDAPGEPEALADRWIAELDRHDVGRAALIASVPGDEESVARAVARHPARLVGFFVVDPCAADAPGRVDAALDAGLRAACLFPAMHGFALHDPRVVAVAERLAARQSTALFAHCGAFSVGIRRRLGLPSPFESRLGNPLDLQLVANRFPALPLIVPHFGAGLLREALMVADLCPSIHLDTSSSNGWIRYHPGLTLRDVFAQALDVVGPSRLLFGTDSSFFPRGWQRPVYEQQRAVLAGLDVGDTDAAAMMGGNFNRLFPAPAAPKAQPKV